MAVVIERERTATATGDEALDEFDRLCRDVEQVNAVLPDGYRTEIIGGRIVMSPWSLGRYNRILDAIQDQLTPHVPEGHRARTTPNLYRFPQYERGYGPDLHVADTTATDVPSIFLPGEALSLVVEQTSSSTRDADLSEKVDVYGRSGVPVYVLVDMQQALVTVFHDPTPDLGYRQRAQVKFGEEIPIPEPFGFRLDTAGWEG